MALIDWINPFSKVVGVVSEVVEDKDKRNQIVAELEQLKQQVYLAELGTKTVPWVDATHKMGRQLLSVLSLIAGVYLITKHPEINPATIGVVLAPGGIYNFIKGAGK